MIDSCFERRETARRADQVRFAHGGMIGYPLRYLIALHQGGLMHRNMQKPDPP